MLKLADIKRLHVELTTRCNARCPMCMRNYRGLDYNSGYPLTELTLDQFKKMFSPAFLTQIDRVLFNGNLGDFGLAKDGVEIVHYLVDCQVKNILILSNGSMRTPEWWAALALPGVRVGFALDGADANTHRLYRQDTDWNSVIRNARAFIDAGGRAVWRFVPFKHNLHQLAQCEQMAQDMGFEAFDNIGAGRDRGPVYTRTGDFTHWLGEPWTDAQGHTEPDIKYMLQSHIQGCAETHPSSQKDIDPLDINCLHKRSEEIYVTATGDIYPCCYLGYYPHTMNHPGNRALAPMVKNNNALEHSLEQCIEWFDQVEQSWSKPSIAQGRLFACVDTCGQWKPPAVKANI